MNYSQSLRVYAFCCVILFLKMFATGLVQGAIKAKTKSYIIPEDAKLIGHTDPVTQEPVEVIRCNNAYRNDLENIPIFLILSLVYVVLSCWDKGSIIYFSTFTFARIMHTVFYIRGMQPWRTIAYGVGVLMTFAVSGHILYQIFK